jgi:segregation and condensation protein A
MGASVPLVDLEAFSGPLDLLLFLIKQEEVDVRDIPIARICDRYLEELERMKRLDLEAAGDFLVMASTLLLIKSRMLLPSALPDEDEEWEDPRLELVQQLLEYRRIRETAGLLEEMRREAGRRHAREVPDPEELEIEASTEELPLAEVSVGELFVAFQRVMRDVSLRSPRTIVYDETPIHVHAADLLGRIRTRGSVGFLEALGGPEADRALLIGSFLALLELVRQGRVVAEQSEPFGEIRITLREKEEAEPAGLPDETGTPGERESSDGAPEASRPESP